MKNFLFIVTAIIILANFTFAKQELINTTINGHPVKVIKVVLDGDHYIVTSLSDKGERLYKLMKKQ
jgi:hypothetical protein